MIKANVKQYFEAMELEMPEKIVPDGELLKKLHYAHCTKIPFTNVVYYLQDRNEITPDNLFERCIVKKQGGICLELHCLFGWLLNELGYKVEHYCATNHQPPKGAETFYHRLLFATDCEGQRWYCDVAAMPAGKLPLKFVDGLEQPSYGENFYLKDNKDGSWTMNKLHAKGWRAEYTSFTHPAAAQDYYDLKIKSMDDPNRALTAGPFLHLKTPEGAISLSFDEYYDKCNGEVFVTTLGEKDMPWGYAKFGLKIEDYKDWK